MIKFHLKGKKRFQIRQTRNYHIWLRDQGPKGVWSQRYIAFQKIYSLGEGQMGFIKNLANIAGAVNILNFIKLYFPQYANSALTLTPIFILSYIGVGYAVGKILDKELKWVDENKIWDNKRDPAIVEILQRLRRLDRTK